MRRAAYVHTETRAMGAQFAHLDREEHEPIDVVLVNARIKPLTLIFLPLLAEGLGDDAGMLIMVNLHDACPTQPPSSKPKRLRVELGKIPNLLKSWFLFQDVANSKPLGTLASGTRLCKIQTFGDPGLWYKT